MENPILKLWKITSNSPRLLPDPLKFVVSYPEESILPTNATLVISFGDGKRFSWRIPENSEDWNGEYEILHVYDKSGIYKVDVEISNTVSKLKKRFQVDVMRKITGLSVNAQSYDTPNSLIPSNLESAKYVPSGSKINYTMSIEGGDVEYFLVMMDNKLYRNITRKTFNATFPEVSSAGFI